MVNIGVFVKINFSFKQLCQLVSLRFKIIKRYVIKDVNLVVFHLYGAQNQFVISVNSF